MAAGARTCVLVAAARAPWEPDLLRLLADADMVVLRRCVDLADLLGAALAGGADAAVVAGDLVGLDADSVRHLRERGIRVIALGGDAGAVDRLTRLGVETVSERGEVVAAIRARPPSTSGPVADEIRDDLRTGAAPGRVVVVWGPAGAPGRTTVATSLAAEHAVAVRRAGPEHRVILCDLDPYGGAVAQNLGILDEVSGLLAAARAANEGILDEASFAACRRVVTPGLEVLTGLPRADRWIEVRMGVVDTVLGLAATGGDVVVDCGFALEDDDRVALPRNAMTVEALHYADRVVVVGGAEPVGLTRLARALDHLAEVCPTTPLEVVVNRMRPGLGWREQDIAMMIADIAPTAEVAFWPEERALLDRALLAGVTLAETGESRLRSRVRELAARVFAADQVANSSESPATV